MKNSKEYSRKIQKLYRTLKAGYPKVEKRIYDEPTDAMVYAIISENVTESKTQTVMKRFSRYFVDSNDLRVSRAEEIVEILKEDTPGTQALAASLTKTLGSIFNEYNTVSLSPLKKIGKRAAKQILEKINGTSRFVVDYCMLTALDAHAIPLTEKMIEYLRSNELVHIEADEQEIEGFLARQISANKAYEFYFLLRNASELRRTKTKKTIKKKTTKKKTKTGRKKS